MAAAADLLASLACSSRRRSAGTLCALHMMMFRLIMMGFTLLSRRLHGPSEGLEWALRRKGIDRASHKRDGDDVHDVLHTVNVDTAEAQASDQLQDYWRDLEAFLR
ncbi:hypothetical protein cyc_05742 [Cyclospora cayetanensis]|uniref:Uncharacterized protein n=1 Tax=Cyclospora cayetanensis TaxID=88456 RepID=A0A1D3DAZ3_9EIME|nr:hypothetical protein cyc_05742 [Cyclospora cayetanensis]